MSRKSTIILLLILAGVVVLSVWYAKSQPQYANIDSPRPIKGDPKSSIVLEEFSDFQCPACGAAQPTVSQILKTYGDKIAFSYRHFPLLSIHANAFSAALASECANDQGKFWEYHDLLFKN
ncbi:MAG: DsbA family protein, partial [Patescibacteria group bacterium]